MKHRIVPISLDLPFRGEDDGMRYRCVACGARGRYRDSRVFDKPCEQLDLFGAS